MSPNLPVRYTGPARAERVAPAQTVEAQLLGQTGARRGLRGGQPVLDAARAAYLDAEWRGDDDRRLPAGTLKRVSL